MSDYDDESLTSRNQLDVYGGAVWYSTTEMDAPLAHDLTQMLNEHGDDGWEMVGALPGTSELRRLSPLLRQE